MDRVIKTDVLVIGGGQAGFFAAMKAQEQDVKVTMVDKATPESPDSPRISPV